MIREDRIRELIEGHVAETAAFLVQLTVSDKGQITVLMDSDDGFTIADCAALSRFLEQQLDRDAEDFALEVSSYGVGNPLVLPRQYRKNRGRLLEIHLETGQVAEGRIADSDDDGVVLQIQPVKKKGSPATEPFLQRFPYSGIVRSLIKIEF